MSVITKAGALYSISDGEGAFRVVKVLRVEEAGVHVRIYKGRIPARTTPVDPARLSLGSVEETDGYGVGHLPLTHAAFAAWEPEFIADDPVTEAELDGYHEWREQKGGFFDVGD